MAADDLILYEKDGAIAILTLNRPEALNAINLAMRDQLWALLLAVRDDPDVTAVVVRGVGERAFCAGADVKEFGTSPSFLDARRSRQERDVWGLMLTSEKPLIAAIHGWALGAGCELSLLCDFRIAAEDARFGLPEVNLGYIPSAGGTQSLPRHVPAGVAAEAIMTAETIDAGRAWQVGLVQGVVSRDRLLPEAMRIARALTDRPVGGMRLARRALTAARDLPLPQGLAVAGRLGSVALVNARSEGLAGLSGWTCPIVD